MYVGGADGGVWKTVDSGASWQSLTDHLVTPIGALAIDPVDDRIIYAGSGEANYANHSRPGVGLYKSSDGGTTWSTFGQAQFSGRCFSRIVIHPLDRQRILAAVTSAGGFPLLAAAKGHPQRADPRGVWESSDGGQTWSRLAGLPAEDVTDLVIDPANPQRWFAGVAHVAGHATNGVYRSIDNGATWTRLTTGLPPVSQTGRIGLAASPARSGRVYAFIARPADPATGGGSTTRGIYRSDDAGTTWMLVSSASLQATYGWYFATVSAHPLNPDEVWFGGLELHRSVNAGVTLTNLSIPHPDVHAIVFDAAGRAVTGDDGGVHRWLGTRWESLNTGLTLTQCYAGISTHPDNPASMVVGLQDNGTVMRVSESSTVWRHVIGGDGGWTQISTLVPDRIYGESQGTGNLARSVNGGLTFVGAGSGLTGRNCFLPPYVVDPASPNRMLYGTERIWISQDAGESFQPLSADVTSGGSAAIRTLAIAPSESQYVYAVTNDGRVVGSTDAGASFSVLISGHPGWPRTTREIFIHPSNPRALWLAAAGYGSNRVLFTGDAGASWSVLSGDLPDLPVNVVAADVRQNPARVFAGAETGVYVTVDGGMRWREVAPGMPRVPTVDLLVEPWRNRLVAATQGRGVWVTRLCVSDWDNSGGTDADDVIRFFSDWDQGRADVNGDSGTDGDDIIAFFAAWDSGC
jgi:photosystem II stability/assembly factor-like uncharacterized protein